MKQESADNTLHYTTSAIGYYCEPIAPYGIRLTIQYGNGQKYQLIHRRDLNEFRQFAYASVVNSAHKQYIIGSDEAHEIMTHLTQSNL